MIYVSSDWHGVATEKIEKLLERAGFAYNDQLYILGDVIDRGENSVELLKFIMKRPNFYLIRGNHEQMLLSCAFLFDETEDDFGALSTTELKNFDLWQYNGGNKTLDGLAKEPFWVKKLMFDYISDTPLYRLVTVNNRDYLLAHAGLNYKNCTDERDFDAIEERDLLWTRPTLTTEYSNDYMTIIGHTPHVVLRRGV